MNDRQDSNLLPANVISDYKGRARNNKLARVIDAAGTPEIWISA